MNQLYPDASTGYCKLRRTNAMNAARKSPQQWAMAINAARVKSVDAILDVGRLLLLAKDELEHGNFLRLFKDHPQAVRIPIAMTPRMAQIYMTVAKRFGSMEAKCISHLPPCVGTLYELSQIEPDLLEAVIADSRVHPGLHRYQARVLSRSGVCEGSRRFEIAKFREVLIKVWNQAPTEVQPELLQQLKSLERELDHLFDPDFQHDVDAAVVQLAVYDAERGGYRIFEDEASSASHPGSPYVLGGVKSTAPDWYKFLTTGKPGVSPLTRKQIDNCLGEMQRHHLPTKRTARAYEAVALAIQGARHSRSEAA
jgi:hypothetical protein